MASTAPGKPAPAPTSMSVLQLAHQRRHRQAVEEVQLDDRARLGDRGQVDLPIPGLQQREVLRELADLRVVERDAERRRPRNQPLLSLPRPSVATYISNDAAS